MKRLEELPDLPAPTPLLLAALLLIWWMAMRIRILRRRRARREAGADPVEAWGWLGAAADRPWILPALGAVAVVLVIAVVLSFVL